MKEYWRRGEDCWRGVLEKSVVERCCREALKRCVVEKCWRRVL